MDGSGARGDEPGGARSDEPDWRTFDRWGSRLFALGAVIAGVVILVSLSVITSLPAPIALVTVGTGLLDVALLYAGSVALARGWSWARTAAVGMLLVLVLGGVLDVLAAFLDGRLTIPIGAIAAAIVLTMKPGPLEPLAAGDRLPAIGVPAVFLATLVLPWLLTALRTP